MMTECILQPAARRNFGSATNGMTMDTYISDRLHSAERKRKRLNFSSESAFRLIDGPGDDVFGLYIDIFAERWLVQTEGDELPAGLLAELESRGVTAYWKQLSIDSKTAPSHLCGPPQNEPFLIVENGLSYEIDFDSGYSQGIFIDQRDNRQRVIERTTPDQRVLNTFAYTCGFSVAAASKPPIPTTTAPAQPYPAWGRRTLAHTRTDPASQYFVRGDTMEWLDAFARKGRTFHGIVLDPPTFSRVSLGKGRRKKSATWSVERDLSTLVEKAARLIEPNGWILCSSNCRKMSFAQFDSHLAEGVRSAGKQASITHTAMPPDFTAAPYLHNAWLEF